MAISKCDAITAEDLKKLKLDRLASKLNIPVLPISSVAGTGLDELKDALWVELNKEQNQVIEISHAPIDVTFIEKEESDSDDLTEEEQTIYLNEVEEEWDLEKYKGIGWDTGDDDHQ